MALQTSLRSLPSVETAACWKQWRDLNLPRPLVIYCLRRVLEETREEWQRNPPASLPSARQLRQDLIQKIKKMTRGKLRVCINATGILLHTHLGRAPLASRAVQRIAETAGRYVNLELNLDSGERGSRLSYLHSLLGALFAGRAGVVVNNNAAGLFLAVRSYLETPGKNEVVISRGEMVEIGGSFRIPDLIRETGAVVREVGTTNRTHLADYEKNLSERTAVILKIHPSNFYQQGYCCSVSARELVSLGQRRRIPVVEDLGSGCLLDLAGPEFPTRAAERRIQDALGDGADCITLSGDKLLGGPQCGIILAGPERVNQLVQHPLYRAFRLSKLDLAALEATLEIYLSGSLEELPIYFQMSVGEDFLQARAQRIVHELKKDHWLCEIEKGFAEVGGGTLPAGSLPTWVVKVEPSSWPGGAQGLAYALRMQTPPVLVRIVHNQIHCDVRTLLAGEEEILCRLFHSLRENEKITDKQTNWGISEID